MSKVKFVQKKVKSQGQGHDVKIFCMERKVLSQGTHMCNMKLELYLVIAKVRFTLERQTNRQTG